MEFYRGTLRDAQPWRYSERADPDDYDTAAELRRGALADRSGRSRPRQDLRASREGDHQTRPHLPGDRASAPLHEFPHLRIPWNGSLNRSPPRLADGTIRVANRHCRTPSTVANGHHRPFEKRGPRRLPRPRLLAAPAGRQPRRPLVRPPPTITTQRRGRSAGRVEYAGRTDPRDRFQSPVVQAR